jgi:tRNA(Ile)-lysidine synthase
MLERFQNHINPEFKILKNAKLLIAVSGGIDSVVLTQLCHKTDLRIALAHCNFNLRGAESDADEAFVLQLGKDLNLEVFVQRFDTETYAKENKRSIQMAARELRYDWFLELARQLEFDYILTAHHADDNLETFLINFTRGTGLEGLTGIPEINAQFMRPLLPFSSKVIEAYAIENKLNWRDDSSNKSVKYLRNKLRHEVVPILKEINPSLLQSFQSTLEHLNDVADIVEESTNSFLNRCIETKDGGHVAFKVSEFKKVNNPKAYLFQVFKDFGFMEWNDVVGLLDAETGKQVFSKTHRIIKNREHLLLAQLPTETYESILIPEDTMTIETPAGILFFDEADAITGFNKNEIYVDKAKLSFPLKLRKRQEGDFFYPLGMKGKKKLSKYFKDEKLSLLDKENSWLLCSDDEIVWVIGRRADNRFKVTENTKNICKITLT